MLSLLHRAWLGGIASGTVSYDLAPKTSAAWGNAAANLKMVAFIQRRAMPLKVTSGRSLHDGRLSRTNLPLERCTIRLSLGYCPWQGALCLGLLLPRE